MSGLSSIAAALGVRRKVFLSYHHGGDQAYYDAFSKTFHDDYELVSDNSLDRTVGSENADYVMRRIRENYVTGSSCTIVLVGARTWGRKYVDWEIDATLQKQHGLIGVRLPTLTPSVNGKYTVPDRLHDNIETGYAVWTTWEMITSNSSTLVNLIEAANNKRSQLINNSRASRLQNAAAFI